MTSHDLHDPATPAPLRVGRIVGAFGLRGQLKVEPSTDFLERFAKGQRIRLQGNWVKITASTMHKGRPLIQIEGVDNVSQAEKLQWEYLEADGLPDLETDSYMVDDLIGLEVVTTRAQVIGKVREVLDYPAHEVLLVNEIMIPLIKQFVKDIDLESGVILVELIPGMLPDDPES